MFKLSHKRPRAVEDGARGLIGIPSHVFGSLLAQVLSSLGFAAGLCRSFVVGLVVGLVADMEVQKLSVNAKGVYNHRCAFSSCRTRDQGRSRMEHGV